MATSRGGWALALSILLQIRVSEGLHLVGYEFANCTVGVYIDEDGAIGLAELSAHLCVRLQGAVISDTYLSAGVCTPGYGNMSFGIASCGRFVQTCPLTPLVSRYLTR